MPRALPSVLVALLVAGLLAAAVLASPGADPAPARDRQAGPLAIMGQRPTDPAAKLEDFKPPAPSRDRRGSPHVSHPAVPSRPRNAVEQVPPDSTPGRSRSIGKPWKGRLENGVQFPEDGEAFFTWDMAREVSPSDWWRRWATESTVKRTLAVLNDFHAAHPGGPRLAVGDLSLPTGGPFGPEYGGLGHRSHQNGRDVDIYYPRRDRAELAPFKPKEVNRALSQDLVDRFVAAGAERVFVGPSLRLRGPPRIVQALAYHDDHVHVRWPKA